jgi:hypothetical protein
MHGHSERGGSSRGRKMGGKYSFYRVRGRSRGGEIICYTCGKLGHKSWGMS